MIYEAATAAEEFRRSAELFVEPGAISEIRAFVTPKRTLSAYVDSIDSFIKIGMDLDARGLSGVYHTLNPPRPDLLARAYNRVKDYAEETTADKDIAARHWLLVDHDPQRPSGISSSNEEHDRCFAVACGTWDFLRSHGFPDPVVADSGNGVHLLFKIDLANTPEATARIKAILESLKHHCEPDDGAIQLDTKVHNAARLTKTYGSMVRKGDSTPNRPWRRSRILEVPDVLEVAKL